MEIQGKVIAVLPIKDGVGKTSGNEWKSREFEAGQTVHVKFDCSARQWENRWFNTLTAWEVTVIKAKEA